MLNFKKIQSSLRGINDSIVCSQWRQSILLEGIVNSWEEYMQAGYVAAKGPYKGVVNKIEVRGLEKRTPRIPLINDQLLNGKETDVVIIGGGVIGASIARSLSKYNFSTILLEKEDDLAMHQSSRNDGMVHPGVNPKPGSKKALYNVKGNAMFEQVAKDLNVPFSRKGTYYLFDRHRYRGLGYLMLRRAKKNGVPGVRLVSEKEIYATEPHLRKGYKWAIHMPTTAVCPPYKMTIALAENAVENGVQVALNTYVKSFNMEKGHIRSIETNRGTLFPKVVINAAGVYSDEIAAMANDGFFTIHPRKGEILLLDKSKEDRLNSVVSSFDLKALKSHTKGGGLVKTVEGNILVGPDAYEQPHKEDYTTHAKNIQHLVDTRVAMLEETTKRDVITYLAGTRASTFKEDFIIEASDYVDNLIHAAGIQSPGFASAPAIAEAIEGITLKTLSPYMNVHKKKNFNPYRQGIIEVNGLNDAKRHALIKANPDYGMIICRCEEISKGEIIDAINSPIPATTLDAIKRRTRGGMGRCQGGFCGPLITEIIADTRQVNLGQVTKKGKSAPILLEKVYKGDYHGTA